MDAMVSSTCSSASIESAPAGFPGFTADNAADVATDAAGNKFVVRERPVSISEAECISRDALRNSLFTISTQSNNKGRYECKRSTPMKLSSISKRGRYDSAFRSAPDYYPLARWRPIRSRNYSAVAADVDLKLLNHLLKEFEWKNRRKSVIRFFDCR